VLCSCCGKGGSCSSETKHGRRTEFRTELFVSEGRLQKHGRNPRETVLGSCPDKGGPCSAKIKHDKKNGTQTKAVCSGKERPRKTILGLFPGKGGLATIRQGNWTSAGDNLVKTVMLYSEWEGGLDGSLRYYRQSSWLMQ
jgi:hypothetical protein